MKKEEAKQNLNKTYEICDLWDIVVPLNVRIKDMDDWGEEEGVNEVEQEKKKKRKFNSH